MEGWSYDWFYAVWGFALGQMDKQTDICNVELLLQLKKFQNNRGFSQVLNP